jgi:hypothetical protein
MASVVHRVAVLAAAVGVSANEGTLQAQHLVFEFDATVKLKARRPQALVSCLWRHTEFEVTINIAQPSSALVLQAFTGPSAAGTHVPKNIQTRLSSSIHFFRCPVDGGRKTLEDVVLQEWGSARG